SRCSWVFYGFRYISTTYTFAPEKVNRLLLYASSCGGKENIPQSPEVVKIVSDFAYNRLQDVGKFLFILFPQSWIKSHSNNISIPQSKEIVPPDTLK
ncbi:MAG: hypothetical protein ACRD8Z_01145, partial [Nitrososphaeraceae archaeon]